MTIGAYQLLIRLDRDTDIRVGKLGVFRFPAGYYVYTGSAMGGVESRVDRHLSHAKRFRWHIDYLLEHGAIIRYAIRESPTRQECDLNRAVLAMEGAGIPVDRFGSSDCACRAHLIYFEREPGALPAEIFDELLGDPGQPL